MLVAMNEPTPVADGVEIRLAQRIASAPPGEARDAEARLYRLLAPRVRRYGLRHLHDSHAADDLMQNVMTLTIDHLRQIMDSLADLLAISERLEEHHERLSIDVLLEVQALYPTYAKYMTVVADLVGSPDQPPWDQVDSAHARAQDQVHQAYHRFLDLVQQLDDAGELADFLSIHQRLRTKITAFVGYLQGGSVVAPPAMLTQRAP